MLDLGSGSGEMLCTSGRDHGVVDRVRFVHDDAAGHVAEDKVDAAACIGATWIAGGFAGTAELLARSLRPCGIILIGEPCWRQSPPTDEVAQGCQAHSIADFLMQPELLAAFGALGYDVVEMVLADQDGRARYWAAKWLTMPPLARSQLRRRTGDRGSRSADFGAGVLRDLHREYVGWGGGGC